MRKVESNEKGQGGESVVREVAAKSFERDVLKTTRPVLVDFWAAWCVPCRLMALVVEELAEEYGARVEFFKLNVDENPEIATQFGVRSIPTILVFKGGELADRIVGLVPKRTLAKTVETVIG